MGKNDNWKSSSVRPRYTSGGNASQTPKSSTSKKSKGSTKDNGNGTNDETEVKGSTCAKYQGWSVVGIRKYNTFFDAIKKEQESQIGHEFEDALLQYSKDNKEKSNKKNEKK